MSVRVLVEELIGVGGVEPSSLVKEVEKHLAKMSA